MPEKAITLDHRIHKNAGELKKSLVWVKEVSTTKVFALLFQIRRGI